jgi:glycosyltransferase involved in cell wall biosynthesis
LADLAFERLPADFDRRYRTYAHLTHRAAALAAGAVISISETTAADARELWGVRSERLVIAHHGPGQELPAAPRPERPAHFLYVGDAEPRKDVPTLVEAYRRYRELSSQPLELVLAGNARAHGPGIRVELGPSPGRLAELYASAVALVQPSRYEGFGLTPLEAMRLGAPVLAARSPGVTEVCGEAARYVPPSDAGELARAMAELAGDPALRRELSERGARRAANFSWSECARRHVEAYSLALSGTHE